MTTSLGTHYTWLLVALPLAGAAILLFGGRRTDAWGHLLGCAAALAAFGVGAMLLADMLGRDGLERAIHQQVFTWIPPADSKSTSGCRSISCPCASCC